MVEYHPYFEHSGYRGKLTFKMSDLETMNGTPPPGTLSSDTNPPIITISRRWVRLENISQSETR